MRVVVSLFMIIALGACGETHAVTESAARPATPTGSCGQPGRPDCPLQSWMKGNASPALVGRDFTALERAFVRIASLEPQGYPGWNASAVAGAAAARDGDLEGCRAACKSCHDVQRARYRAELAAQPLH
jgi:hypothetical protein